MFFGGNSPCANTGTPLEQGAEGSRIICGVVGALSRLGRKRGGNPSRLP